MESDVNQNSLDMGKVRSFVPFIFYKETANVSENETRYVLTSNYTGRYHNQIRININDIFALYVNQLNIFETNLEYNCSHSCS